MKCNAQICMNTHTYNTHTTRTCAHKHTHTHTPKYTHAKTQIFLMHKNLCTQINTSVFSLQNKSTTHLRKNIFIHAQAYNMRIHTYIRHSIAFTRAHALVH